MIDKRVYELDYIRELQQKYASDPGLIERALYAFGLLEAMVSVGMPFCFKGGTSLMLILDKPARLSTDIDILVEPGTDVDSYIDKAARIFPFLDKKEDIRNDLLLTEGKNLFVEVPTADCILGDKLTAFAPHTTGVLLGTGKELEIAKQLFDIAILSDYVTDYDLFSKTYDAAVTDETAFRGVNWSKEDVLRDTIRACVCIISRGSVDKDDYAKYLRGIKSLRNHILLSGYNTDYATWSACKVMYLASCLLSGSPLKKIKQPENYLPERLEGDQYKKLAYRRHLKRDIFIHRAEFALIMRTPLRYL